MCLMMNKVFSYLIGFSLFVACIPASAQPLPSNVPTNGLLAWWGFSGDATDMSGNGHNGIIDGATLTSDRFGDSNSAYNFDGENDYINVGQSLLGPFIGQTTTVNAWVKLQDSSSGVVLSKYANLSASASNYFLKVDRLTNKINLSGNGRDVLEGSLINSEDWLMLSAIYNEQPNYTAKIYVNGSLVSQGSLYYNKVQTATNTLIGRNAGSPPNFFKGKIDDVGAWNRALTAAEIVNLYDSYCNPTYATDSIVSCKSYIWTNGITYTTSNNIAKDTFENARGCDSIVTLNLLIPILINGQPNDQSVLLTNDAEFYIGTPQDSSLTYQWQTDLGAGLQSMSDIGQYSGTQTNALKVSFITTENDNQKFRCLVSNNDCQDTSEVVLLNINKVSINDILSSKSFRIYPNPTKDWIHISVDSKNIGINYTITSVTGEKLYEGKIENLDTAINIQDLAEGIYFIQLGSDTLRSFKLLKQ